MLAFKAENSQIRSDQKFAEELAKERLARIEELEQRLKQETLQS